MTLQDFAALVAREHEARETARWAKDRHAWKRVNDLELQVDLAIRAVREGREGQFDAYGRG